MKRTNPNNGIMEKREEEFDMDCLIIVEHLSVYQHSGTEWNWLVNGKRTVQQRVL